MTNIPDPPGAAPSNERLRRPAPKVIDQRQQQIDPAGLHRRDPDDRPDTNTKQPGASIPDRRGSKDPEP